MRFDYQHVSSFTGHLGASDFSAQLLEVGKRGIAGDNAGFIKLPFRNNVSIKEDILTSISLDIGTQFNDHDWLQVRTILAPHNITVHLINSQHLNLLLEGSISFKSIDRSKINDNTTMHPIKFFNTLTSTGLPNHD